MKAGEERLSAAGSLLGQEDCAPMGLEGSGAFGHGRDRDLGSAFQYSRRLTRLMDKPLWGLRVLKFDGAIAPRVLKFDSGFAAEGCGGRLTFIEGALL